MADMNINIIQTNGDTPVDNKQPKGKSDAKLFNNVRSRKSKFSMSISDYFGEKIGDKLYDRIVKNTGGSPEGKKQAKMSKFNVVYGFNTGAKIVSDIAHTSLSNVGNFTSNQAYQNKVDNIMNISGDILGAVGTIGSAAMVGGVPGAVIAAIGVTANKALELATASMNIAKDNLVSNAESQRISDRLGYVETGYSR